MNCERYGPTNMLTSPPETIVTTGVSTMSIFVFPATSEPTSFATVAAAKAPTGPPTE